MLIRQEVVRDLERMFGHVESERMIRLAKVQASLESHGVAEMRTVFDFVTKRVIQDLIEFGRINGSEIYDHVLDVLVEQSFYVREHAYHEPKRKIPSRLAKAPKIPKGFADLMQQYDLWRKKKKANKREKAFAEKIKDAYLKKVGSVWDRYSEDFRAGDRISKEEISDKIRKAADTVYPRAKMITETETTRYYNRTRREIYDVSPDVTHYLFIAIRDHRTTKWCKSRHMLIYAKTDPLLDDETPPIHWNCRSEIVPLTEMNPAHAKLIKEKSRQRRTHQCEPLPKGWKRS